MNDETKTPAPAGAPETAGTDAQPKQNRGFKRMDPARQREIASRGGKAAHAKGVGHQWNREEARIAGRKGGAVSRGGRGKAK
jgi:general stress protein YciG